jgi:hypothetical protein
LLQSANTNTICQCYRSSTTPTNMQGENERDLHRGCSKVNRGKDKKPATGTLLLLLLRACVCLQCLVVLAHFSCTLRGRSIPWQCVCSPPANQ